MAGNGSAANPQWILETSMQIVTLWVNASWCLTSSGGVAILYFTVPKPPQSSLDCSLRVYAHPGMAFLPISVWSTIQTWKELYNSALSV
jgi:hypothetical protein